MTSSSYLKSLALPLITLVLAASQALPTLLAAWGNDVYARGAALAFAIWLAALVLVFFKSRHHPADPALVWIAIALFLCAAGAMSSLRVLQHLALAAAVPGLIGLRLGGFIAVAAAPAWLPASGWFLSQWKVSGFVGWERPAFAVLMALPLLYLSLRAPVSKSLPS